MLSIFCSYSHKDEKFREQLLTHLKPLERQGVFSTWHDRQLLAGDHVDVSIDKSLNSADIILLLVSADFLASEYCYSREMTRAMERHRSNEARVIPVILRSCDWQHTPFGKLLAAPTDGLPVAKWLDQDDAFLDITNAIRNAANQMRAKPKEDVNAFGAEHEHPEGERTRPTASGPTKVESKNGSQGRDQPDVDLSWSIDRILAQMKTVIGRNSGLNATIKFDFGESGSILIDGKTIPNLVTDGMDKKADCSVKMNLDTFGKLVSGELDGTSAFEQGKLRITGNMDVAMKLGPILQRARA
jgi:putative sterol carrier protein